MNTDFTWLDGGSVILLTPHSAEAEDWAEGSLPDDAPCLGSAIGIERRYFGAIYEAIIEDGLTISPTVVH